MVEVDYPHGDSTWPDTQLVIEKAWGHVPAAELRAMCCENAAALYRHPLPDVVVAARRLNDGPRHARPLKSTWPVAIAALKPPSMSRFTPLT